MAKDLVNLEDENRIGRLLLGQEIYLIESQTLFKRGRHSALAIVVDRDRSIAPPPQKSAHETLQNNAVPIGVEGSREEAVKRGQAKRGSCRGPEFADS